MRHFITLCWMVLASHFVWAQTDCPNPYDGNGDGAVAISDLLDLLSLFGDSDSDGDGIWDSTDACVDLLACNYDASPTEPCQYLDALGECGGPCEGDSDGDGLCDDQDFCFGSIDECGVCNGSGPSELVVDDIVITYDSVYLPLEEIWFVYGIGADTLYTPVCAGCEQGDLIGYDAEAVADEYPLTVSASPAVGDGGTVYRFYVTMENETDQMSAVFGNNVQGLVVHAPSGVFNSVFNSSWNASGINPAFLSAFPELVDDTYATIGLTGPAAASGIVGAADPSYIEDSQPILPFFLTDGAIGLEANSQIGASWYVLTTAANSLPDANGQVLVMQVTTDGPLCGQLSFQILLPEGDGFVSKRFTVPFNGVGEFYGTEFVEVQGCMDPSACNYNPEANLQPIGSCDYTDVCGICDGPGIPMGDCDCNGNTLDGCGVCGGENTSCTGCNSPSACNYDPDALVGDLNTCLFPSAECSCEQLLNNDCGE